MRSSIQVVILAAILESRRSGILIICANPAGFLHIMRENYFTLCENYAPKLLILRDESFQFMREPTTMLSGEA